MPSLPLQPDQPPEGLVPQLRQGFAHGSAPAALRAADSRSVKAEVLRASGRFFLLTVEEVCATPDFMSGTFLVNFVPALVLFKSGVSGSFVSIAFSHHISI